MNNYFDAPPEGALQTAHERALSVDYKANKTPEAYAHLAQGDALKEFVKNGALGFSYFDKENNKRIPLPEMTFVILEVYAGVSGYDGDNRISYWSNRAKDTRKEPLTVFASNHNGPICSGLYQSFKEQLPKSANYAKFVKAYCVQLDRVIELKLTASSERGMQKAIAAAEASTGRMSNWEKVFILSLPDNDHLWGFHLTGYSRETKEGEDYAGRGELYISPVFHAGTVNPVKQPDLHAKCVQLQNAERASHEAYKAKYAHADAPVATTSEPAYSYTTEPVNTNVRANHTAVNSGFPTTAQAAPAHHAAGGFPETEVETDDSLPF